MQGNNFPCTSHAKTPIRLLFHQFPGKEKHQNDRHIRGDQPEGQDMPSISESGPMVWWWKKMSTVGRRKGAQIIYSNYGGAGSKCEFFCSSS